MKYFIAGGCGFIGSTLAHKLLEKETNEVFVYDNLSSGSIKLIEDIVDNPRFRFLIADINNFETLVASMKNYDIVYHFASNADIAKAIENPTIDFYQGTLLTQNILEAMRINKIKRIVYASGSGIYGDYKEKWLKEDTAPMLPISPYGASKLAGEAMICAYSHMFDIKARIYRFANVVGKNQTHGVVSDFIKKLKKNKRRLEIMGDGNQKKCYVHVDDIINAMLLTEGGIKQYEYYNVSSETSIAVWQIVDIVLEEMGLTNKTKLYFGETAGGWQGDVPIVNLDSRKIRKDGWKYSYTSEQAIRKTAKEILEKNER